MPDEIYTASGVRMRLRSRREGNLNFLMLPGGPGIGSESLVELAHALDIPGAIWLIDLPGDGSNRREPRNGEAPYASWPQVVLEAAIELPNVIFAGHSTGGMYLLATPELEKHVKALLLIDTAPDSSWHPRFVEMTERNPLTEVARTTAIYESDPCDENIAALAVATAEWNFTEPALAAGRELLCRMPYNNAAVAWSDANFDHVYRFAWWPERLPVLIMAGAEDRIVWQGGWDDPQFHGDNAMFSTIPNAGHWPWIDNPKAVTQAVLEFLDKFGIAGGAITAAADR